MGRPGKKEPQQRSAHSPPSTPAAVTEPSWTQQLKDLFLNPTVAPPPTPARIELVLGLFVVFMTSAVVYGATMPRSVAGGDSGELMCVAHELGTAHPPGYPSFTFLTKIAEVTIQSAFDTVAPILKIVAPTLVSTMTDYGTPCTAEGAAKRGFFDHGFDAVQGTVDTVGGIQFSSPPTHDHSVASTDRPLPAAIAQNIFHTFLSVLCNCVVLLAGARLTGCVASGVLAALVFGFAPNVWTYAVVTEVFALNNFCMAMLLWLAVEYWRGLVSQPKESATTITTNKSDVTETAGVEKNCAAVVGQPSLVLVSFAAFFCGFSLTNQHTSILYAVPITLWVLLSNFRRYVLDWKVLLLLSFCFFAGMAPYLYLPWSSANVVTVNSWGVLNRWKAFWAHFLRDEYGTFSLASKESTYRINNFARTWRYFVGDIHEQMKHGSTVALGGAIVILCRLVRNIRTAMRRPSSTSRTPARVTKGKKNTPAPSSTNDDTTVNEEAISTAGGAFSPQCSGVWSAETVLLLVWILYTNFFNYLSNLPIDQPLFYGVQQRFWLQPLLISVLVMAVGTSTVANNYKWSFIVRVALALAFSALQISRSYTSRDEHDNFYVRNWGRAILAPLPNNAVVLTKGDLMINSARAVQVLENFRPDVILLDQELMTYTWYIETAKKAHPGVVFPAAAYYPNREGRFDMKHFLDANFKVRVPKARVHRYSTNASLPKKLSGSKFFTSLSKEEKKQWPKRRIFTAYGWKEGDPRKEQTYKLRPFGVGLEVVSNEQYDEMRQSVKAAGKYAGELIRSLPTLGEFALPEQGRYDGSAWEMVVFNDFRQAMTTVSHELMTLAEILDTVTPDVVAHFNENPGECVDAPASKMLGKNKGKLYCGLIAARQIMATLLADVHGVSKFVRRNLGVASQTMLKFDQGNLTLATELRDHLALHLKETRNDPGQQDRGQIEQVVQQYTENIEARHKELAGQ